MILLYENLAVSTLNSGIPASALTVVLATGTGSLFPQPVPGQSAFYMTFLDAATKQVNEVVLCTARAGDALTIVRAQQGTTALTWGAADIATQLWTMGDAGAMLQPDALQENNYGSAQAVGTNSLTASIPSNLVAPSAPPDLFQCVLEAQHANTGAVTLTLTLGSTVLPAFPIHKAGGSALNAGDIAAPGAVIELTWSATLGAYIMTNPGSGTAGSIAGGAANEVLYQTAVGTTGFVTPPTIAGQVLAWTGSALAWLAAAVTSFNGRAGAVVSQAGDYSAAQVGAIPTSAFRSPNVQFNNPMFMVLPYTDGSTSRAGIIQFGNFNIVPNARTVVTYPKAFPNQCISITATGNNASAAISVENLGQNSFAVTGNITLCNWIAGGD